ncbi:MAG: ketoacyl-ACP synthase III [Gemmataceae bacterium]|nr:ketoacyl-ACP synthase III [Gemmataceae bacterium]
MEFKAAITGWGWHSPEHTLSNHDLEKLVDTTDSWIRSRTGIRERRVVEPGETTSTMCLAAAEKALSSAELKAQDLDLVLCATTTPDFLLPATACLVQQHLGAERAGAFDLNAACSGFVYGITVASQFIQAGTYRRVLVAAGECLTRFTNWQDRNTCILFGDGAAAVVLEATKQNAGVLSAVLGSHGDTEGLLSIEGGGSAHPASVETVAAGMHHIRMRGNEVFKKAVRMMVQSAQEAMRIAKLTQRDLDLVVPHQANSRILSATQESLGIDADKMFINLDRLGNTGAASVPLALAELASANRLKVGDNLLLVAFGGGLTWAAAVVRWADIAAIKRERARRLTA